MDDSVAEITVGSIYSNGQYRKQNSDWHASDSPWKSEQILKILRKNMVTPTSICEVGCGSGEILRQLSVRFPEAQFTGYEVGVDAFEICRAKQTPRLDFYLQDILEVDITYDLLLCIDVFEHVENYMGFLRGLKEKADLKVFHIPLDLSVSSVLRGTLMRARRSIGHLHYFTLDTALATLVDCGYTIVDYEFTTPFADLPARSLKGKLAKMPRGLLHTISPKLMSATLGGCSLMVLAE